MSYRIKDSGKRQTFESGAVRDTNEGEIHYDLLPIECLKRVAYHYTKGAEKYSKDNWKKGVPTERWIEGAWRHWAKYLLGMKDEDHLSALVFNVFGIIYNEEVEFDLNKYIEDIKSAPGSKAGSLE